MSDQSVTDFMELFEKLQSDKPAVTLAFALSFYKLEDAALQTDEIVAVLEPIFRLSAAEQRVLETVSLTLRLPGWNRDEHGRFRKMPSMPQICREKSDSMQRAARISGRSRASRD